MVEKAKAADSKGRMVVGQSSEKEPEPELVQAQAVSWSPAR
jgi:hypothetical protein